VRLSESFDAPASAVLAAACKLGLEGVMAKRADAPYRGGRSPSWLKLRTERTGDFAVVNDCGDRLEPILDLPEACELDATPLVARPVPGHGWEHDAGIAPSAEPALMRGVLDPAPAGVFSFENQDVFAGAGSGGAPRRTAGARVRFFALLPRFDRAGGDTAVLVREVPVGAGGAVRASGLPAAIPMFEQLVAANGIALMTAHGPAHVAGANAGSAGATTRCVGCHLGHSRQAVAAR